MQRLLSPSSDDVLDKRSDDLEAILTYKINSACARVGTEAGRDRSTAGTFGSTMSTDRCDWQAHLGNRESGGQLPTSTALTGSLGSAPSLSTQRLWSRMFHAGGGAEEGQSKYGRGKQGGEGGGEG